MRHVLAVEPSGAVLPRPELGSTRRSRPYRLEQSAPALGSTADPGSAADDRGPANGRYGGPGWNEICGRGGHNTILLGYDNRYNDTQCAPAVWDTSPATEAFRNALYNGGGIAHGGPGNDLIYGLNGADTL